MRLLLLAILAAPMFGQTEICRFRAADPVDPFRRWLSSQEVICGTTSELPPGKWNVFARDSGGLSSPVFVDGKFDVASLSMQPAATIMLTLPSDAHGAVVYVPRRAIAYPVHSTRVLVPAGEPLWVMNLDRGRSVMSIVPVAPLDSGSERAVDARVDAVPSSVLGWLRVSDSDAAAMRASTTTIPAPQVHLGARDADLLPSMSVINGAFVLVRNVVAGEHELALEGHGWLPHATRVSVGSKLVTAVANPLLVRPAASLLVSYSSGTDASELDASLGSCDERNVRAGAFHIAISACPAPKGDDAIDPKTCGGVLREQTFDAHLPFGQFIVDDVPPGTYMATLTFGKLPPVRAFATAPPLQQHPLRLFAPYVALYGSLTRGGAPLGRDAAIAFPAEGIGFSAADADNEYHAVLLDAFDTDAILEVAPCEGEKRVTVLANEPARPYSRFDIDIPENSITLSVTDTFTSMPLPNATVEYVVLSKRFPKWPVITKKLQPADGKNGVFVIEAVPEREIQLTVSHGGYSKYPVQQFTMTKSEHRKVDVQMMPLRGTRGRIVSPIPFDEATISWHRPAGRAGGETVEIAPDGTFAYDQQHEAGEAMTVVSRSHPLWVFRMPAVAPRQTLELRFPDAPVRTFEARGSVTATVGDVEVPTTALSRQQRFRNGWLPILETGVIRVYAKEKELLPSPPTP